MSLLLCTAALSGCSANQPKSSLSFQAMDTFMKLDVYGGSADEIKDEILRLDKLLSVTDPQSDIYTLNQSKSAEVDDVTAELARRSLELCRATDGALDVTVLPVVEEWGFISGEYKIPSAQTLNSLLGSIDYTKVSVTGNTITLPSDAKIDFGATAKGFAADRAVELLKSSGATGAILNLGGTVAAYGQKPGSDGWRVGIADPENTAAYIGYITCRDKIIATSGGYERCFEGEDGKTYCHIIDPKTGLPADNGLLSVTVISDSGTLSDALSTALFVMGAEKAAEYAKSCGDFDFVMLTADGRAIASAGAAQSFTPAQGYDIRLETVS